MFRTSTSVFALVALVAALLLNGAPAQAAHVSCGSVVSGHVVLDSNVNCVNASGLTVGADGTTIDLNGFAIICTGAGYQGSCQGAPTEIGIDTNGKNNVLIKGPGTVKGFDIGVLVPGGTQVNVRGLTVTGPPGTPGSNPRPHSTGILVTSTHCPSPADTIVNIHGNEVSNHTEGIELSHAQCVNVGHNFVHHNNSDPFECHGILLHDSSNNNANNNRVEMNGESLPTDGGLTLTGTGSANNTLTHNTVSNNLGDGISARSGAHDNQITNNVAKNNTPSPPFFDLVERSAGSGNKWNKNNRCNTQGPGIPAGVCGPTE